MRCTINAKDENKEASAVRNLFHNYLGTSVLLVYVGIFVHFLS
jgi:hypothetical protein